MQVVIFVLVLVGILVSIAGGVWVAIALVPFLRNNRRFFHPETDSSLQRKRQSSNKAK